MVKAVVVLLGCVALVVSSCSGTAGNIEKIPSKKAVGADDTDRKVLKRKVAIARFTNETKYGKSSFFDDETGDGGKVDMVEKQAMDILSARLASTNKFLLLERSDLDLVNKELSMANLETMNIAADYLIVGSVSEFGRKTTGSTGLVSRSKRQTAYARVNIRLIEVRTGQIIFSQEGEGEAYSEAGTVFGMGGKAGFDGTLNDKAISTAISKLVGNIIENITEKPWRSYIIAKNEQGYLISGGQSQGIATGDVFAVMKKGDMVKNPQTGMMIEMPGEEVGRLKVVALMGDSPANEVSLCSETTGSLPADQFTGFYVQELR